MDDNTPFENSFRRCLVPSTENPERSTLKVEVSLLPLKAERPVEVKQMDWECIWPAGSSLPAAMILEPLTFTQHSFPSDRILFFSQTTPEGTAYRIEFKIVLEELSGEIQTNTTPWFFDCWSSYAIFRVLKNKELTATDFFKHSVRLAAVRTAQRIHYSEPFDLTNPEDRVKLTLSSIAHSLSEEKLVDLLTTLEECKDHVSDERQ